MELAPNPRYSEGS